MPPGFLSRWPLWMNLSLSLKKASAAPPYTGTAAILWQITHSTRNQNKQKKQAGPPRLPIPLNHERLACFFAPPRGCLKQPFSSERRAHPARQGFFYYRKFGGISYNRKKEGTVRSAIRRGTQSLLLLIISCYLILLILSYMVL